MKVRCVECARWKASDQRMAAMGFANCEVDRSPHPKARYHSAYWQHECSDFRQEDASKVAERLRWLDRKREEAKNDNRTRK